MKETIKKTEKNRSLMEKLKNKRKFENIVL
jgi:hypothetical protein